MRCIWWVWSSLAWRICLIIIIRFCLCRTVEVERFLYTDTSAAVIIQADAWRTEWFRGKWEIYWRIHFIVFAIDGQLSVTKVCKYMNHWGFMSQIYSLTEQLSSKCQCWERLTMPRSRADLSSWKVSQRFVWQLEFISTVDASVQDLYILWGCSFTNTESSGTYYQMFSKWGITAVGPSAVTTMNTRDGLTLPIVTVQ